MEAGTGVFFVPGVRFVTGADMVCVPSVMEIAHKNWFISLNTDCSRWLMETHTSLWQSLL